MFDGNYKNGLKNGRGKFKWSNESEFVGEFKNNKIEGLGVYRWTDGRIYNGLW